MNTVTKVLLIIAGSVIITFIGALPGLFGSSIGFYDGIQNIILAGLLIEVYELTKKK